MRAHPRFLILVALLLISHTILSQPLEETRTVIPGQPAFMEMDFPRNIIYVSIPSTNEVLLFSMETQSIVDSIGFVGNPKGLDLSDDGDTLYVGLAGTGTVGFVDLANPGFATTEVYVADQLDFLVGDIETRVFDVLEYGGNRVFVTGTTGSSGLARVLVIDKSAGNSISVAGGNTIIRDDPMLLKDPAEDYIYIHEPSWSPASIYKLDPGLAGAPIVLDDHHGDILPWGGVGYTFRISGDGQRLYLKGGQIVSATTLVPEARPSTGINSLSSDERALYIIDQHEVLHTYDTSDYSELDQVSRYCEESVPTTKSVYGIETAADDKGWYLLVHHESTEYSIDKYEICYLPAEPYFGIVEFVMPAIIAALNRPEIEVITLFDFVDTIEEGFTGELGFALLQEFDKLTVTLTELTGNIDLFMFQEASTEFECSSTRSGTKNEKCVISNPGLETWFVRVFGVEAGSFRTTAEVERVVPEE